MRKRHAYHPTTSELKGINYAPIHILVTSTQSSHARNYKSVRIARARDISRGWMPPGCLNPRIFGCARARGAECYGVFTDAASGVQEARGHERASE